MLHTKEPIRVGLRSYGSIRTHISPSSAQPIHFFDPKALVAPSDEVVLAGCSEVFVQGRLCGDFYVELVGPRFCVSAVAADPASACRDAFAQAGRA